MKTYEPAPIVMLRKMVNYFNWQNETFNTTWDMDQLLKIATFAFSEQGGLVHECADMWPEFLLDAVLEAPRGEKLPDELVQRASKLAS